MNVRHFRCRVTMLVDGEPRSLIVTVSVPNQPGARSCGEQWATDDVCSIWRQLGHDCALDPEEDTQVQTYEFELGIGRGYIHAAREQGIDWELDDDREPAQGGRADR